MLEPSEIEIFLHRLCDLAALETLPRFRNLSGIENKLEGEFDPVTEADRAAEEVIRKAIRASYPSHGIVGEEYGIHKGTSNYKWVIDPIDGTRAFISGLPVWGTLIGLYHNDRPHAGIVHQPFTEERFFSASMGSYFQHGSQSKLEMTTSRKTSLSDATIMTTTPMMMNADDRLLYDRLEANCRLSRYGCDCYAYAMLAAGNIDIVMESGLNIYDIAAQIPVIEQAGGVVTDWSGDDASKGGHVLAVANPTLHAAALRCIAGTS